MNAHTQIQPAANVYAKIAAVQGDLAKVGIAKNRRNTQGSGYNFRGIDDVYSALSPLLAQHKLVIVPRVIHREVVERASRGGGALFYVTVHAEFDFISAEDGSIHTAATFGEAMDSSDKATNKAMSAAYKYAAFMTFAIPTEGDNDADATTHEVAPRGQGHSQGDVNGAVSPAPAKRAPDWDTPIKNTTGLKRALKSLNAELEGCADSGMVYGITGTQEWKDFVQTAEIHAPHYLYGGEPAPEEFEGLLLKAQRMVREFDSATANEMADLAHT